MARTTQSARALSSAAWYMRAARAPMQAKKPRLEMNRFALVTAASFTFAALATAKMMGNPALSMIAMAVRSTRLARRRESPAVSKIP